MTRLGADILTVMTTAVSRVTFALPVSRHDRAARTKRTTTTTKTTA
ncbi:MAG: hypothetical protein JJ902_17965 [Roseibium sp.]|nr:hypothetical protein [Roseibium sp.]